MAGKLSDNQKKAVRATIPAGLTNASEKALSNAIERSLNGVDIGNAKDVAEGISEYRAMMRRANGKWEDCGDHCVHHLDNGDAKAYGVCYWACIARGGPKGSPSLVAVHQEVERFRRSI